MKPNSLVLNPYTNSNPVNPICPDCDEEIRELSSEHENRFICGCEKIRTFEFKSKS